MKMMKCAMPLLAAVVAWAAEVQVGTGVCAADEDWKTAFRRVGFDPDAKGSSYFLVTSDIHAPSHHVNLAAHVAFWNAMEPKPAFVAALGDIGYVNSYFGQRPKPEQAAKTAADSFGKINAILSEGLRKDVPHVYVVGNHDTYPCEYDRALWRKHFPDQPIYGVQDFCGIRFMKWDGGGDGIIHEEQEKWILEECAAYPKDKPLVILVHQPSVGATGMERDIGRVAKAALAGRPGVTWMLAGHNHCNADALWDLPGGGRLMVATHTRDIDGWWAYGIRDGQIVARIFKGEKEPGFKPGRMPGELRSHGEIPLAYKGRTDVVWKCFVGDGDERAARVSIGKTGDNDGAFFYVDKLRYRFPKARIAPKATRFAILGNLCGKRKTKEPARCFFSSDGETWTEAARVFAKGGVNEYLIPSALVGAAELHVRYEAFGMGCDESIAGFSFLAESVPFNDGWEFSRDRKTWQAVGLPHDWAIGSDFDPVAYDSGSGALPWKGVGWYRRRLVLTEDDLAGRRFFLDFGGVQGTATVNVNRQPVAKWRYGYLGFTAPLVPYLTTGTNEVVVKADTTDWGSRWYPGAGIYRGVKLRVTGDVRLEKKELFVTTPAVSPAAAKLVVRGAAYSHLVSDAKGEVTAKLVDPSGAVVAEKSANVEVPGCALGRFELAFDVKSPRLWEMRDPAPLYTLVVSLAGAGFSDRLETRVGFRDFRFDANEGFFLNGRRVQLNGVDLHADLGILGMAFNVSAMRRQLKRMRDMGVNALRTSHNPPAEEVLDLCDEMGIFVWDEAFDKWNATCGRGEEPLDPFVERVLTAFVRRDRNHPSVFVWSIGNEIPSGGGFAPGQETWGMPASIGTNPERCTRFRNVVRAEDATRPVGIGSCFPAAVGKGDYAALDITGWNYNEQYVRMHGKYPEKPVLYSESASAFSDYGFYAERLPTNKTDYAWDVRKIDSYDRNSAAWSDIPDLEFERMERDRYCCGEFVWTGIDYLGEPSPYSDAKRLPRAEHARSSYFGIYDLLVMPKDRVFLYRAHWNKDAFTLHIVPHHWNFAGRKTLPVYVYSSADEVELFVNGASQGRRRLDPEASFRTGYYDVLRRYRFIWDSVPYAAGEVRAVAYGRDGRTLGEQVLRTAGTPVAVVVTPEEKTIPADGETLVFAAVTLADAKGTFVPDDSRRVSFKLSGPGEIVAVGNADPRGRDSFKKTDSHALFFGRAGLAVRRFRDGAGPIVLTASAEGLKPAVVTLD